MGSKRYSGNYGVLSLPALVLMASPVVSLTCTIEALSGEPRALSFIARGLQLIAHSCFTVQECDATGDAMKNI